MRPTSLREASPMNSTLRAAALGATVDERRPARDVRRQQRHELALWFEPAQAARAPVCEGCREQVPFVIWMVDPPGWRCTACAAGAGDGVEETVPTIVSPGSAAKLDTRTALSFMSEWVLE